MVQLPSLAVRGLTALAALIGLVIVYLGAGVKRLGAEADWWEAARDTLPLVDDHAREAGFYTVAHIHEHGYVGHSTQSPEAVELALANSHAQRNPLAAHKTDPEGREEVGSWAWRELPASFDRLPRLLQAVAVGLAVRQVHVTLFAAEDGGTIIYAHEEYNPFNPMLAMQHVFGVRMNRALGVTVTREKLAAVLEPVEN